jgi:hypothetical protein
MPRTHTHEIDIVLGQCMDGGLTPGMETEVDQEAKVCGFIVTGHATWFDMHRDKWCVTFFLEVAHENRP